MLAAAEVFIFGSVIGLVIIGVVYGRYREKKRTRELEAIAREQGFTFSAGHDSVLMDSLLNFQLFSHGRGKSTRNVLSGQAEDTEFFIFDYRYTTGSGKHATTHHQTVLLMQRAAWNLPRFYLRPESLFSKIGKVFGYDDINFETHPEFSRQYNLSGASGPAVKACFTDDLLAFYESQPGLCTEADGTRVILYRAEKHVAPAQIADFYALGWSLREVLPSPAGQTAPESQ